MRKTIFETKRLIATTLQESDIEPLWRGCFSDWEVMKLLLGKTFTFEEAKEYIDRTFSKGQLMDLTVVFEKESRELIGYAGMFAYHFNNRGNEYEFGYILKPEAWGKGYATELSWGQIKKLQEVFADVSIVATAHPQNIASKRVLEKVDMVLVKPSVVLGNRGLRDVYILDKKGKR